MNELQLWTDDVQKALETFPNREQVVVLTYAPLSMLYAELVKKKEIPTLTSLDVEIKLKYWNETSGNTFRRKVVAQALYIYDLINNEK